VQASGRVAQDRRGVLEEANSGFVAARSVERQRERRPRIPEVTMRGADPVVERLRKTTKVMVSIAIGFRCWHGDQQGKGKND